MAGDSDFLSANLYARSLFGTSRPSRLRSLAHDSLKVRMLSPTSVLNAWSLVPLLATYAYAARRRA